MNNLYQLGLESKLDSCKKQFYLFQAFKSRRNKVGEMYEIHMNTKLPVKLNVRPVFVLTFLEI